MVRRNRHGRRIRGLMLVSGLALTLAAYTPANARADQSTAANCPPAPRIACVDLSHQIMWVESNGRTTWGPVRVRTGAPATPTRTGLWHIYRRLRRHNSTINGQPMPFSQFFDHGIALHGTRTPLTSPPGSLGCVTMAVSDAASLWHVTRMGDPVYVFGHRPSR